MKRRLAAALAGFACLAAVAAPASATSKLPPIKHVFTIVLENKAFDESFGFLSPAHYLAWTLPSMGALVPNFYAVGHESLPNYIAMISGQGASPPTQADCVLYVDMLPGTIGADGQALGSGCAFPSAVKTIANQLAARGLTWKGYMEDMGNGGAGQPKTCRHPALGTLDKTQNARQGDQYAARHNPFVYFHSIIDTPACAQNDVPLDRLPAALASAPKTANYTFITPNLCDDGHDSPCVDGRPGGLRTIDVFLRKWVPRILASPAYRSGGLLAIVFDETDAHDASACCNEPQFPNTPNNGALYQGRGGGRVGAVFLSPYIDPGTLDLVPYNDFSLLRSTEDLFGVGHLGYAARPGLQPFGPELFTCYRPGPPRSPRIKLAVIGQGTAPRPMTEVKLWYPGRVSVKVSRRPGARARTVGRTRAVAGCQLLKIALPYQHGVATVTVHVGSAVERRTLVF